MIFIKNRKREKEKKFGRGKSNKLMDMLKKIYSDQTEFNPISKREKYLC